MRRSALGMCALALALAVGSAPTTAQQLKFKIYGGMSTQTNSGGVLDFSKTRFVNRVREKQLVEFERNMMPGSILVDTSARELFYVLPDKKAWKFPVGVGRQGYAWSGANTITRKAEWPDWRPPKAMIAREAKRGILLPAMMPGGQSNPLGARALYIGTTEYRIHGTTQPATIGRAVSSGCIRMLNEHVIELFGMVNVGATVVVEH
jgi:lipoprotein-anchoring transpeptidase ErfK/SrfK